MKYCEIALFVLSRPYALAIALAAEGETWPPWAPSLPIMSSSGLPGIKPGQCKVDGESDPQREQQEPDPPQ